MILIRWLNFTECETSVTQWYLPIVVKWVAKIFIVFFFLTLRRVLHQIPREPLVIAPIHFFEKKNV